MTKQMGDTIADDDITVSTQSILMYPEIFMIQAAVRISAKLH